jgi:hypothetical protein
MHQSSRLCPRASGCTRICGFSYCIFIRAQPDVCSRLPAAPPGAENHPPRRCTGTYAVRWAQNVAATTKRNAVFRVESSFLKSTSGYASENENEITFAYTSTRVAAREFFTDWSCGKFNRERALCFWECVRNFQKRRSISSQYTQSYVAFFRLINWIINVAIFCKTIFSSRCWHF